MDYISVPLAQIQASLELLCQSVVDHERCAPEDLDRAVVTLSESHEQLGGETRRLLYGLFAASRDGAPAGELIHAVQELGHRLHVNGPKPRTAQLRLFTLEDEP